MRQLRPTRRETTPQTILATIGLAGVFCVRPSFKHQKDAYNVAVKMVEKGVLELDRVDDYKHFFKLKSKKAPLVEMRIGWDTIKDSDKKEFKTIQVPKYSVAYIDTMLAQGQITYSKAIKMTLETKLERVK